MHIPYKLWNKKNGLYVIRYACYFLEMSLIIIIIREYFHISFTPPNFILLYDWVLLEKS